MGCCTSTPTREGCFGNCCCAAFCGGCCWPRSAPYARTLPRKYGASLSRRDARLPAVWTRESISPRQLDAMLEGVPATVVDYRLDEVELMSMSGVTQMGKLVLVYEGEAGVDAKTVAADAPVAPACGGAPRTMFYKYTCVARCYKQPMIPDRLIDCMGNSMHEGALYGEHMYYNEVQAATDAAGVPTPVCFACVTHNWTPPDGCRYKTGLLLLNHRRDVKQLLVMEDLGAQHGDEGEWGPWETMTMGLGKSAPLHFVMNLARHLAEIHSACWGDAAMLATMPVEGPQNFYYGRVLPKLGVLGDPRSKFTLRAAKRVVRSFVSMSGKDARLGAVADEVGDFGAVVEGVQRNLKKTLLPMLEELNQRRVAVIHGDYHVGNVFFRSRKEGTGASAADAAGSDGGAAAGADAGDTRMPMMFPHDAGAALEGEAEDVQFKVIDWAWMAKGTPAFDLVYLLQTSVNANAGADAAVMRAYHAALLKHRPKSADDYPYETLEHDFIVLTAMIVATVGTLFTMTDAEKQYDDAQKKGGQVKILYEIIVTLFVNSVRRLRDLVLSDPAKKAKYFG